MSNTFTVTLPDNWRQRWPEIRDAAAKYNFTIARTGDDIDFEGFGVAGNIKVTGSIAHVTINKTPFFLSAEMIESMVRNFLTKYR